MLVKDERNIFLSGDHTPIWTDFHLAALRALLASLLSPRHVRSSHLALALDLFQRGTQETSTKLAEYCGNAFVTLEVLIHPRALPLSDNDDYKTLSHKLRNASDPGQISTYQVGTLEKRHESEYDEMHENWSGNDDEMEIPMEEPPATVTLTPKRTGTMSKDFAVITEVREGKMESDDGVTTIVKRISTTLISDDELSTDSFPDIVDGDPHSD